MVVRSGLLLGGDGSLRGNELANHLRSKSRSTVRGVADDDCVSNGNGNGLFGGGCVDVYLASI